MLLVVKATMIIFGIIHLLPLPGMFGATQLERLYGVALTDPNLIIMMRHRALLFALLACFVIFSAFKPDLVWLGIAAGVISAGSFVWFAWSTEGYNAAIGRIVVVDIIATACLAISAVAQAMSET